LWRLKTPGYSSRVVKDTFFKLDQHLRSKAYKDTERYNQKIFYLILPFGLLLSLSAYQMDFRSQIPYAVNSTQLLSATMLSNFWEIDRGILWVTCLSTVTILAIGTLWSRYTKALQLRLCTYVVKKPIVRGIKKGFLKLVIVLVVSIAGGTQVVLEIYKKFTGNSKQSFASELREQQLLKKLSAKKFEAKFDPRGFLTSIKFNSGGPSLQDLRILYNFGRLEKIELPNGAKLEVDLSKFSALKTFVGPADTISGLSGSREIKRLVVYDPGDWLDIPEGSTSVSTLEIRGKCSSFGELYKTFPLLQILKVNEDCLKRISAFPTEHKNLVLEVADEEPKLEWLNEAAGSFILCLRSIPSDTSNHKYVRRLCLDLHDIVDPRALKQMKALEWLRLNAPSKLPPPGDDWFKSFWITVNNDLTSLATLELNQMDQKDVFIPVPNFLKHWYPEELQDRLVKAHMKHVAVGGSE